VIALDPSRYTTRDAIGTIGSLGAWWRQLGASSDDVWASGPIHSQLSAIAVTARALGVSLADANDPIVVVDRTSKVIVGELQGSGWRAEIAHALLRDSLQAIHDAAADRRAAGLMPQTARGVVHQLSASTGGVPKTATDAVVIGEAGVVGDRQATRRHHGRPWQALCLWSLETIDVLRAEGHPIAPGLAGENVTISGLPWADVTAGVHLQIGEALVEVSLFSPPCSQNARWFSDGDFSRISASRGLGLSRVYASVVHGGRVVVGDAVVLEPSPPRDLG
jgi:MOSC domain-containing protein YiiM